MTTTQSHTGHVTELMSAAYDGELGSEEQRAFEQHLGTCKACHAEYESFKRSLSLVKGLGETQAPDDFVNVITNDINHQTRGRFFNERVVFGVRVPFEGFIVIFLAVIAAIL
ncbi:MAG: zf-HC2 domain-containing protein, partial [Myxococcota bacterium]|nr:zf-HC2 domain-containing protein [Myxococcota bacterium]